MTNWGYNSHNGPLTWHKTFQFANGQKQSPIDLDTNVSTFSEELEAKPLEASYEKETNLEICNNGHTIHAAIKGNSFISGGPLSNKYKLEQFHLHWGSRNDQGSEHTVDGRKYAAELHLVHWNSEVYQSFAEAADKPNGLAVFGILIKVEKEHEGFKALCDAMEMTKMTGQRCHVTNNFDPKCLLPASLDKYWTYPGSLTTPPCYESVTWIVFQQVMEISQDQLSALRSLVGTDPIGANIQDNYRPVLSLGKRALKTSFLIK